MAIIYIRNQVFPVTPNPVAGDFYLGIDSVSGHLTRQDSLGVVIDLESGATYTDADAINAVNTEILAVGDLFYANGNDKLYVYDAQSSSFKTISKSNLQAIDPDKAFNISSDFIATSSGEFNTFTQGSGATVANVNEETNLRRDCGISRLRSGTTLSSRAGIGLISITAFGLTNFAMQFISRVRVDPFPDATDDFEILIGFSNGYSVAGLGADGVHFRHQRVVNGNRWQLVSREGSADLEVLDSGVELDDLDYHRFEIRIPINAAFAQFYIDDVLVGTINAPNIPSSTTRFGAGMKIQKTAGTSNRDLFADYMSVRTLRTSAR